MITGGVFGIFSNQNCLDALFIGILSLQHRGQEYCGLSVLNRKEVQLRTHRGLVVPSLENDLQNLEGYSGIGHVSSKDRQPISRYSNTGEFNVSFDGHILNANQLRTELFEKGHSFSTLENIELIATLIAQERNVGDGIERMMEKIQGPCSLVLLTQEGIYAARDILGFKPLVLGIGKDNQRWAVASESCAFNINNIEIVRDVKPGEIVLLNQDGISTIRVMENQKRKVCSFEWIYYARPDSIIEGVSVTKVRHNLGGFLAKNDEVKGDIVGPVPFSGILHAEGYHRTSGLPNVEVFLLPQYIKRTYIMPLEARKKEKDIKLTPIRENTEGQKIILVDDSIRSGITMKGLVTLLREAGAKEVHVRIASPASIRYCPYERPAKGEENFIASLHAIEEIKNFIRADSLRFQELENVPKAIGLPRESLCLDCFL